MRKEYDLKKLKRRPGKPKTITKAKAKKEITAEELDAKFEAGEDISTYLDLDKALKKVNVDFPLWMVKALDREAERLQIPRQAVLKMWIDEKVKKIESEASGQAAG